MEYTTTTIQGKEVTVNDRDKKNWEKNVPEKLRNDPDFRTDEGDKLKKKAETLESPKLESTPEPKISNQEQNVPEKSLQESSKSIYDFIDESEFTEDRGNWRSNPTDEQLEKLNEVGYDGPQPKSSRQANEIIGKRIPPSEKSKNFLNKLNYSDEYPTTEFDAINLIDQLRPPIENQLKEIRKLGGNEIPQSYSKARELIFSLTPVTFWQNKFLRDRDIEIPENEKEANDKMDQYLHGTSIQSDPCPKCEGSKEFDYGTKTDECPYCDGSGDKKDYDEDKGDQKILDDANQEYNKEHDSGEEDMNDSGVESKTTDTPQDLGYAGFDYDNF